jgi:hypothetical protein
MPEPVRAAPDPRPLALLTLVVVVAGGLGVLPRWPGLLHLVALAPFDQVADLQLLLVRAPDPFTFTVGVMASLAGRSALLAWALGGLDRARFWLALRFNLITLPVAVVAASLSYGAMAVLFYMLFWIGLMAALLLFAATGAAPWMPGATLRARFAASARSGFRLGTLGAYLAALTALGVLADLGGPPVAVTLVPVSAALTWLAAWLLATDPGWRPLRRALALVPGVALVGLAWVVLTGPAGPEGEGRSLTDAEGREGSILLMSGVDSSSGSGAMLEIDPTAILGWPCESTWHFSYAGPGDGQPRADAACPIDHGAPYEPEDTLRSVDELVGHLEAFVSEMPPPVVVTGHSQGAWLVWEAAATGRLPGADAVVLVGAFPENRVWYPPWGERAPGAVGRMVLDVIVDGPRPGGTSAFEADSPLGRELLGHPTAVAEIMQRPLPDGMRALSVTSAFDLPLLHGTHRVAGATDACPVGVVHPNLPYAAELQGAVVAFLDGDPLPPCPAWRTAVGPLLRHFTVPPSPPR